MPNTPHEPRGWAVAVYRDRTFCGAQGNVAGTFTHNGAAGKLRPDTLFAGDIALPLFCPIGSHLVKTS